MKYLAGVRGKVRQVLLDEFVSGQDLEWQDDELDMYIGLCLDEISEYSPYKVREVLTTTANSRVLDISSIGDLLEIEKLEYPTGRNPRSYRNYIEIDAETIEIDTTRMPTAGGSGTLLGLVTFTNGSATVTGSSTDFEDKLKEGYHIKKSSGTRWYRVYSIESDTSLTLAEPCLEISAPDIVLLTQYSYETVYVYCDKLHQLTRNSSTLNRTLEKILVRGVSAKAAIAKSQDLINKVNVGGARVASNMEGWGLNQLSLYRDALKHATSFKTYRTYPKD